MKVVDYWKCANKHLDFCEEVLNSVVYKSENCSKELNSLIDIYYMLGYIFEGFTVCIAFSLSYPLGDKVITWDMTKDVDYFDQEFIAASGLAFDRCDTKLQNAFSQAKKKGLIDLTKGLGFYINAEYANQRKKDGKQDEAACKEYCNKLKNDLKALISCTIASHQFDRITSGVIQPNFLCSNKELIPFFQSQLPNSDQSFLIEKWGPELRYGYADHISAGLKNNSAETRAKALIESKEKITEENLRGLIDTCRNIRRLIPTYFKHFK